MQALKLMLVISIGLGSTWAAWQIFPSVHSPMLVYAQEVPAEENTTDPGISDAEIEEQLARIEAAMETYGEIKEFRPSEPLPADMAIEMSSDL
ncbi:MAG: hypothetical protein ACR2QG_13720 [Gammaproteobacteria bacterium]